MKLIQAHQNYACHLCGRPILVGEMHYREDRLRTHRRCRRLVLALMHGQARPEDGKAVR